MSRRSRVPPHDSARQQWSPPGARKFELVGNLTAANFGVALLLQGADEMTANETASAGDDHKVVLGHKLSFPTKEAFVIRRFETRRYCSPSHAVAVFKSDDVILAETYTALHFDNTAAEHNWSNCCHVAPLRLTEMAVPLTRVSAPTQRQPPATPQRLPSTMGARFLPFFPWIRWIDPAPVPARAEEANLPERRLQAVAGSR